MYGKPQWLRIRQPDRWVSVSDTDVETREDGSFVFEALAGGPRRIAGTWGQPGGGTAILETRFDLDPAQHLELGSLQPAGLRVQVRVILVDRDGNDVTTVARRS